MGACHACDLSDIWMGDITQKHLDNYPLNSLNFHLYRDDAIDFLENGDQEKRILEDHLNNLHENLTWTVDCVKEGGYLDLWLMLEDGKIEWKNFSKAPPIYVGPDSSHDPAQKGKSIIKGVGRRIRINSSKNEYFEEAVEVAAKGFKISGYKYQKTKRELMKFKDLDPIEEINKEKIDKKKPDKGVQAFLITDYDPRMPHPRQLISKNYHHIQSNPQLADLFPRENLVGGSRRGKNLSELLSPTVQSAAPGDGPAPGDSNDDDVGGAAGGTDVRRNGSYHCDKFTSRRSCDVCSYMQETSTVTSYYFKRRFAIHGRNIHLPASQKKKLKWFVYGIDDTACKKYYVGSTSDVTSRWANTKKACKDRNLTNTGLYKHFHDGCPTHLETGDLSHLTYTLLDYIDTSEEQLRAAGHTGGVQCRCSECQRLKDTEDKWICRLGTFNAPFGLNSRDEIKSRVRVNFRQSRIGGT